MDENQLRKALQSDPLINFAGVFSSDEIPKRCALNHFYVFNTAPSNHPGEHWIVIYSANKVECFDSLALQTVPYIFKPMLGRNYELNREPVQNLFF